MNSIYARGATLHWNRWGFGLNLGLLSLVPWHFGGKLSFLYNRSRWKQAIKAEIENFRPKCCPSNWIRNNTRLCVCDIHTRKRAAEQYGRCFALWSLNATELCCELCLLLAFSPNENVTQNKSCWKTIINENIGWKWHSVPDERKNYNSSTNYDNDYDDDDSGVDAAVTKYNHDQNNSHQSKQPKT